MLSDIPFILKKITNTDPDIVRLAFGQKGLDLLSWVESIDLSHPGLFQIKSLSENSDLLNQYLDLFVYAKSHNMHHALNFIKDRCENSLSKILQEIGSPYLTHRHFRFANQSKLKELRKIKLKNKLSSSFFHEKAIKTWYGCPSDFSFYERNSTEDNSQKIKNKNIVDKFIEIGCPELASVVSSKTQMTDDYFGFKRIGVVQAAFILAKMHKFIFAKTQENSYSIVANTSEGCFLYSPTISPLVSFEGAIPDFVLKLVEQTDKEPLFCSKPIFDNHLVLIPSLGKKVRLKNQNDHFIHFKKFYSEEELVNNNLVRPIVLGEKDKECYFICGWT